MENYDFSFPDPAVDILMALYILDADGRALAERRFTHQMPNLDDSRVPYEVTDVNSICGKSIGRFRQVVAGTPQPGDQRFLEIVPTGGTQPAQVQLQSH
jgi:hypothetical protein